MDPCTDTDTVIPRKPGDGIGTKAAGSGSAARRTGPRSIQIQRKPSGVVVDGGGQVHGQGQGQGKHKHTQSLGLLSPIPSFASLATASPTRTRPSSPLRPSTPRTPLRHKPSTPRVQPQLPSTPRSHRTPRGTPTHSHTPTAPLPLPHTPRSTTPRTPQQPQPTTPRLLQISPFSPILAPTPTLPPLDMPALSMPSPVLPSAHPQSPPRSQSRSERLLRDTLRRDEMALRSPRSPPLPVSTTPKGSPRAHRRRHSHVPVSNDREVDEFDRAALFFRSAVASPQYPFFSTESSSPCASPRRQPSPVTRRRPSNSPTTRRPPSQERSPSPSQSTSTGITRRASLRRSPASEGGLVPSLSRREEDETPHGQVLRMRLERVLVAGRVLDREVSPSRMVFPEHRRTRSRTDPLPQQDTVPPPLPQRSDTAPTLVPQGQREKRFKKRNTGYTPPLVGGSQSDSRSGSGESVSDEEGLLTPPPTPPSFPVHTLSPLPPSSSSSNSSKKPTLGNPRMPQHLDVRPTFNARQASAHCRQIEGYVSFSAVEGLGAPPEPGTPQDEEESKREMLRERGRGGVWDWTKRFVS